MDPYQVGILLLGCIADRPATPPDIQQLTAAFHVDPLGAISSTEGPGGVLSLLP